MSYNMIWSYFRYNMATGGVEDRSLFKKFSFHYAVFDEGHMLKNMSSLRFQNLMKISVSYQCIHVYICSSINVCDCVSGCLHACFCIDGWVGGVSMCVFLYAYISFLLCGSHMYNFPITISIIILAQESSNRLVMFLVYE